MEPVQEKLDGIGGLAKLKSWLKQKATVLARLPEARALGVDAPKGIMFAVCRAAANP